MGQLAAVYILDVPYHADKPYTYSIPPSLADCCRPGCLAEVPFGKGNRKMTAIITDLPEGVPDKTTKPLLRAGGDVLLSDEMLRLCRFMKDYTLCSFGDAVRAVLPGAALAKIVEYFVPLPPDDEKSIEKLPLRAMQVYQFLSTKKKLTRQRIQTEFTFDCTEPLAQLQRMGLAEKLSETKSADEGRFRHLYFLTEYGTKQIGSRGIDAVCEVLRSPNQKKLLARLADAGEALEEKALFAECGVSVSTGRSCMRVLTERQLVFSLEEELFRDPFRLAPEDTPAPNTPPVLTQEQKNALSSIVSLYESGEPKGILLHGVTGSGKTAVMLASIERVLADGRGVIMLVPEIALTPQTVDIFRRRFGERIAVIHSSLSAGERLDAWRRIKNGLADVVIGTRSAIFAPLPRLGMILIDEEHEYTYKSDTNPKYHTHDIARWRCGEHKAVMLLSSATPSVTSYYKAKTGAYTLVELKTRFNRGPLPQVEICDMRGQPTTSPVGETLAARLHSDKAAGNQSILFLNRRGYNHFVSCRSCGKSIQCPHCSVSMTYHTTRRGRLEEGTDPEAFQRTRRENGILACHLCGYRSPVPEACPACGKPHFLFMGCGTQKAEDDIESLFPDLRLIRMDTDTTHGKFSHEGMLSRFRRGEADVLLGTQMVTKGHDFPKVATVGVLNADGSLFVDDYRANERTFAMLTQVIGRAGRGDVPGKAIIQTWNPDNEVLHLAAAQDYARFYDGEIRLRQALCYPPFCDIAVITVSGADEGALGQATTILHQRIRDYSQTEFGDVPFLLFGPFEAPVYRVQNICRMRFVIKCRLNRRTREFIDRLLCDAGRGSILSRTRSGDTNARVTNSGERRVNVTVDLNPSTI